jgi:hypothetical protein
MPGQRDIVELRMDHLEASIQQHLVAYLAGQTSLDDFTSWLVSATWNIGNTGDAGATELAYAVEFALAEHSSGLLTDDELRTELLALSRETKRSRVA